MSITFQTNSILTTLQDLGRSGHRKLGINPSGTMDTHALRLINSLLGNDENEVALEMHFPASEIRFNQDAVIALGGANFGATIDGQPIANWRSLSIKKDSLLKFPERRFGARCYLAIKGGFKTEKWLGSSSTNLSAGIGKPIKKGDILELNSKNRIETHESQIASSLLPFYSKFPTVRIIEGADFQNLNGFSEQNFLKTTFSVSTDSNRMGFRLSGESLYLTENTELLSTAVNFGSIQLLPSGQLIVLMADHQTSGGYPNIANVISIDLPLLAQLNPGDRVAFHRVSIEEAERLTLQFERDLSFLRAGISFQK